MHSSGVSRVGLKRLNAQIGTSRHLRSQQKTTPPSLLLAVLVVLMLAHSRRDTPVLRTSDFSYSTHGVWVGSKNLLS